jgi:single-stranded DNA-binding protein
MALINEVHISGRVATEPKQFGKGPFKFRIGHGGGGNKKNGEPWPTQWFSVATWDTKLMEGVAKGAPVEVFGKLRDASHTAKDGTQRSAIEIVAEAILVHQAEKQRAPITPNLERNLHGLQVTDDDIPF